jgi:Mn-containing catalase
VKNPLALVTTIAIDEPVLVTTLLANSSGSVWRSSYLSSSGDYSDQLAANFRVFIVA